MKNSGFGKMLSRRTAAAYFLMGVLFLCCVLRVASLATASAVAVGNTAARRTIEISRVRGTVYDCRGVALNNRSEKIIAAVSPNPRALAALRSVLRDDPALAGIEERLSRGKPLICTVPYMIECEGITCLPVAFADTSDKPAVHTVGYVGADGHGLTGLEAAFDGVLYSDSPVKAVFETDGSGKILGNRAPSVEGNEHPENALYTTLELDIQRIVEESCEGVECGAAVVCEIGTGKLRAVVSKPNFDCTAVSEYISRKNSPLVNRALSAYSVGSVFKPCVAAAGIESGMGENCFECTGSVELDGVKYRCHNRSGHGTVSLSGAIALSCNAFFYKYAVQIGCEALYEKMRACSLGMSLDIAGTLKSAAGVLPERETLYAPSALANLSIGQGELLLSPVALLPLYCAIASDGGYYLPTLIEKQTVNGVSERFEIGKKTQAMKKETAAEIRKCLEAAVEEGTGTAARAELCKTAGKTATAQTGRYDSLGNEINIGWFCGYFPAESPKYVTVVMIENANGYNAAPVFSSIADGITALENGIPSERQVSQRVKND